MENEEVYFAGANAGERDYLNYIYRKYLKRIFDVSASAVGLIVLCVPMAIVAVFVKVSSKGPVFVKHSRIGKDGKEFEMYKFRSMIDDAENCFHIFTDEQMEEFQKSFKLTDDPRVTKIGKVLRKTSIDELPQMINIFKGDMSIIGPRPIVEHELNLHWGGVRGRFAQREAWTNWLLGL